MKKSDLKILQDRMSRALAPPPKRTGPDSSDELARQFDDGTDLLGNEKPNLTTPVTPVTGVTGDAAPKRDFTRTANSIVREAVPAGMFTGKGKQLYDYLYAKTRGAIVPVKSARIPTEQVMKGSGMTRHTFRAHTQRLISQGLIKVEERPGEHGGNIYTVLLPEETDRGDRGLSSSDSGVYGHSKTSFKTKEEKLDDEAFAGLVATLRQAGREVTGKGSSAADAANWEDVALVLATELKIAAARTTVSNVPAFLAEHLRRRLFKKDAAQLRSEAETSSEAKETPAIDVSTCLDCGGSGFWYPEGYDKGVVKCRHEKLSKND